MNTKFRFARVVPADKRLRTSRRAILHLIFALVFGNLLAALLAAAAPDGRVLAHFQESGLSATGTVLYEAEWAEGMDGWTGAAQWQVVDGVLVNVGLGAGSAPQEGSIDPPLPLTCRCWDSVPLVAPLQASVADYIVQAEIEVPSRVLNSAFGIIARDGALSVAVNGGGYAVPFVADEELTGQPFDPGTAVHQYRLEVRGNTARFAVDGSTVLEVEDDRLTTSEGGQVGLWSQHPLYVHSFKVMATAQSERDSALFPYAQGGKWGFIDRSGDVVIEPRFAYAKEFSEGLAPIVEIDRSDPDEPDGRWGWGFVDTEGTVVIEPQYDRVYPFVGGLALVESGGSGDPVLYGYIDRTGTVILEPQFPEARDFSEGLALVAIGKGDLKYGYVDSSGHFAINPIYDHADSFSEGLAKVIVADASGGSGDIFFIDRLGKRALDVECGPCAAVDDVGAFSEGLAPVSMDGRWGFIDSAGTIVIDPQFENCTPFAEGLAGVELAGMWGYIDASGHLVINPQFDEVDTFAEGRAIIVENTGDESTLGYIDTAGTVVVEPRFEHAERFHAGLALVVIKTTETDNGENETYGYIDTSGTFVFGPVESGPVG